MTLFSFIEYCLRAETIDRYLEDNLAIDRLVLVVKTVCLAYPKQLVWQSSTIGLRRQGPSQESGSTLTVTPSNHWVDH